MKKCLLSFLLVIALIIGAIPVTARANDMGGEDTQTGDFGSFIDGNHVISDMIEKNGANAHPRLIMTDEKFAKLKGREGEKNTDGKLTVTGELLRELRGEADRYYKEAVSGYELDDEGFILETSKRIQRRVASLALAYNIFGDEKYAERCYKELEAACKFPDWSPKHFLDTAEMCTAFAYGYDWLYNWMTPEQRAYIRNNMIEKGLNQVAKEYRGELNDDDRTYFWYAAKKGDNWQFVCTGGTNLAALAIGDEADAKNIAAEVLDYGFKKAYYAVRTGYDIIDGTYEEGLGYWDYATYYLGLQSSALISTTGSDYGLTDYDGIRKSVDFVRYMSSNIQKSFSFGDDGDSRDTGWAVFLWLGEHFNAPELSALRLIKIKPVEEHEFNYLDVLWIDESKQTGEKIDIATDWGAIGTSNASFRDTWDKSGIVAALHVGENNYIYHGHYDLGSFYIESNEARFFTDLGNEDYNLKNRKKSYRIKAEGHNTLVINPTEDIDQREGAVCRITEFNSGNKAYAVTDLTDAYEPSGAKSVKRGLEMIKDKKCVVIQDEISLKEPGEIYWFAHTTGDIVVADDSRSAVVTVGSEKMWVGLMSEGGQLTSMDAVPLETSLKVDGAKDNSDYSKLAIHYTNTKDVTITVACIPLKEGENSPSWTPKVMALSEWASDAEENHNYVDAGNGEHRCTICGIQEKHDFSNQTYQITEDKKQHYQECKICGAKSVLGNHENTELINVIDATCTEKGYTGDLCCKDCAIVIEKGRDIDVLGHTWDEGKISKEPTKDILGEKIYTCIKCGATKVVNIDGDYVETDPEEDLDKTNMLELSVKGKLDVSKILANKSDKKPVAYAITSADKKAAKVTKSGILTARKAGNIEVTAYADKKKTEKIGKVSILIKKTMVPTKDTVYYMDENIDLMSKITDLPYGLDVKFSISEKQQKYATVNEKTGVVTPIKNGKARVTVLIGEGKYAAKFYTSIFIKTPKFSSSKDIAIKEGKSKIVGLKNIKPNTKITWSVSDSTVVNIAEDNRPGKIKVEGIKTGKTLLTAEIDGRKFTKNIEVRENINNKK